MQERGKRYEIPFLQAHTRMVAQLSQALGTYRASRYEALSSGRITTTSPRLQQEGSASRRPFVFFVGDTGLEPVTFSTSMRRSSQLS